MVTIDTDFSTRGLSLYLLDTLTRSRILKALRSVSGTACGMASCTRQKRQPGSVRVDVHSSLAKVLRDHLEGRRWGFVFRTKVGTPLAGSNVLRRSLHRVLGEMGHEKCGFHAFRRLRVTHLRKQRVPEDLLRFWIGHADGSVTDGYSKVKDRK
jgi:integrase